MREEYGSVNYNKVLNEIIMDDNRYKPFADILLGGVFMYEDALYIKCDIYSSLKNAVCLRNGQPVTFSGIDKCLLKKIVINVKD